MPVQDLPALTASALVIADLAVQLLPGEADTASRYPPKYQPFVAPAPVDFKVWVHDRPAPDLDCGRLLFSMPGHWEIGSCQDRLVVRRYAWPGRPSHVLTFDPADLSEGQVYWVYHRPADNPVGPDYGLEYPLDMLLYAYLLLPQPGVIFHAAGVELAGRGLLFAGPSGSGKSTLAGLWQEYPQARVLNDDRLVVRRREGVDWLYGTPWPLKGQQAVAGRAPLAAIYFLQHAGGNWLRPLGRLETVTRLVKNALPPYWDAAGMAVTLAYLEQLAERVPAFELGFRPDASVLEFIQCQLP
ncbi:MAG: hypothetical protein JW862_01370 [Anaerolineales bacterium]|nr:hypothetical protein [Anaerolineales bacterium]